MMSSDLLKVCLAGCLFLPIISNAQPRSLENYKSLSQGIKENPIMGYVLPVFEDFRINELHSDPKSGSLRVRYNTKQKNRISSVSAKKTPRNIEKARVSGALAEAIDKALPTDNAGPRTTRSFTTAKGVDVNCIGVVLDDKKISNSICYAMFDNYYIQANMVWALDGENKEQAFSRSDGFVKAVIDRFDEYPEI
ncbi:hypothetical protein [Advenella mimigardefordensis]|nr:hypothetical protein [Advenella mimigardefordensis]